MSKIPRLFELMEKQGIKEYSFAKATGISPGNIGDWKRGRSAPTIDKLIIVADYLNCSVDYLLGRTDNPDMTVNNQSNINGNNSIHMSAVDESENEIRLILANLSPRERTELMMMIYKFADEHKK